MIEDLKRTPQTAGESMFGIYEVSIIAEHPIIVTLLILALTTRFWIEGKDDKKNDDK